MFLRSNFSREEIIMYARIITILAFAALAAVPLSPAYADEDRYDDQADEPTAGIVKMNGVVRQVHKEELKLMISHESIPAFDMWKMTMVFRVRDKVLLDQVKVGDKADFVLERKEDGSYVIIGISQAAK